MINKKVSTISDLDRANVRTASWDIREANGSFNLSISHAWMYSIQPSRHSCGAWHRHWWACFNHFRASITRESVPFEFHRIVTPCWSYEFVHCSMCLIQNCVIMTGNNCKEIMDDRRQLTRLTSCAKVHLMFLFVSEKKKLNRICLANFASKFTSTLFPKSICCC